MGYWGIIIPEYVDVVNIVANPSIEIDTTGWSAMVGSIARSVAQMRRGSASLAATPAVAVDDGIYYGTVSLVSGQPYTVSVDFLGAANIPYKLYFATTGGVLKGTATQIPTMTSPIWKRYSATWTADATATFRIYITKDNNASAAVFYVDGLMCVNLDHDTSYIDGEQPDCYWQAARFQSQSVRPATSRNGGREYNLDALGLFVTVPSGIGMPAQTQQWTKQAFLPGGRYLGAKVEPRMFMLTGTIIGSSRSDLHLHRKIIIDAIKPDAVAGAQPFWLKYYGSNIDAPVWIRCVVDTGMGFGELDGFTEKVAIRMIAYDPFFYEDGNIAAQLTTQQSIANANYAIWRKAGVWQAISTGFSMAPNVIKVAVDGTVYFGGMFSTAGGVVVNGIAKWDGSSFSALGTGVAGGSATVNAIAIAPNGDIYIGGDFTTAGGVTCNNIARWDGSWHAVGVTPGTNLPIYGMCFGNDGNLYLVGDFTTAGGVACVRIAKWDGSAYTALSSGLTGGATQRGSNIKLFMDGNLYVVGYFTTAGGVTCNGIAKWDGSAFSALGGNINNSGAQGVFDLVQGKDGSIYVCGSYSSYYLAKWTGTTWVGVGTLPNNTVSHLIFDNNGLLYVTGSFTTIGGLTLTKGMAVWNGTTWAHVDFDYYGVPAVTVGAMAVSGNNLYVGVSASSNPTAGVRQTVNNSGTKTSYPTIIIKRVSGGSIARMLYLKNSTTGATLWFDYYIQIGETLTISFDPVSPSIVSNYFGSVWRALLRNSDFVNFNLLPGNNLIDIYCFQFGSPTMASQIEWKVAHWGADGSAK